MALAAHLQELRNKHQTLDAQIQDALKTPAPDAAYLSTLKKQKLQIKEKITALSN